MMDFNPLLNATDGSLSADACLFLFTMAQQIPEDGVIFDMYSGEGRSTIAMAMGLEAGGSTLAGVRIVSMDTHITNPMSMTPYEDGTILKFLGALRKFRVINRVSALIGTENLLNIFNKRSANLVVIQSPSCPVALEDVMATSILHAQGVIRRNGHIVVVRPRGISVEDFRRFVAARFGEGFTRVENGIIDNLIVYIARGA